MTYLLSRHDQLHHQIDFNQTTKGRSQNGCSSKNAPPKRRRYRSICPYAHYLRRESILHIHLHKLKTLLYKWNTEADVVESPSCGTGEIPDS